MPQGALDGHRMTLRLPIRALYIPSMPTASRWPLCESWEAELRGEPLQKLEVGQGCWGRAFGVLCFQSTDWNEWACPYGLAETTTLRVWPEGVSGPEGPYVVQDTGQRGGVEESGRG